ncbi:MAG: hypothetical protein Q4A54_01855 [Parabacteroides sp.]|nr:hypothetical protein [Parabacteroides sp.]
MCFIEFIDLLQLFITLADSPKNKEKVRNVLIAMNELPGHPLELDVGVKDTIYEAVSKFDYLIDHREEFAKVFGDTEGNKKRYSRLAMYVRPNC